MTSITARQPAFLRACLEAGTSDAAFGRFRQHPAVVRAMENVSEAQGRQQAKHVRENFPHLLRCMHQFAENDQHGGPAVFDFREFGDISPVTLRYINILGQIERLFGSLDGKRIVEIGGGYGGQAAVVWSYFKVADYLIYDLPEVSKLQRQFLRRFSNAVATRLCSAPCPAHPHDLVISNYAFSECDAATQSAYLDNVLSNARAGFMICNFVDSRRTGVRSMTREQLLAAIPGSCFLPEEPLTHAGNAVLVWTGAPKE